MLGPTAAASSRTSVMRSLPHASKHMITLSRSAIPCARSLSTRAAYISPSLRLGASSGRCLTISLRNTSRGFATTARMVRPNALLSPLVNIYSLEGMSWNEWCQALREAVQTVLTGLSSNSLLRRGPKVMLSEKSR